MKCYNHHDRDAFGVCTVCGKGLCLECMKQDSKDVRCKNNCQKGLKGSQILSFAGFLIITVLLLICVFD